MSAAWEPPGTGRLNVGTSSLRTRRGKAWGPGSPAPERPLGTCTSPTRGDTSLSPLGSGSAVGGRALLVTALGPRHPTPDVETGGTRAPGGDSATPSLWTRPAGGTVAAASAGGPLAATRMTPPPPWTSQGSGPPGGPWVGRPHGHSRHDQRPRIPRSEPQTALPPPPCPRQPWGGGVTPAGQAAVTSSPRTPRSQDGASVHGMGRVHPCAPAPA